MMCYKSQWAQFQFLAVKSVIIGIDLLNIEIIPLVIYPLNHRQTYTHTTRTYIIFFLREI